MEYPKVSSLQQTRTRGYRIVHLTERGDLPAREIVDGLDTVRRGDTKCHGDRYTSLSFLFANVLKRCMYKVFGCTSRGMWEGCTILNQVGCVTDRRED